jgi:thiol-disulfide isomerase/thioredoxin
MLLIAGACYMNSPAARAFAEPAKSGGQAAISGKVVDASTAPVAGASVTLYRLESSNTLSRRFKIVGTAAVTDGAGTYKYERLEEGYFLLSVEKDGFARTFHAANIQAKASEHVDIVLTPPVSLVIHVKDQDGKPVAGARIRAMTRRGVNGEFRLWQLWMRSLGISIPPSDEQGNLRLPLPSGESIKATIEHPRLAPVRIEDLKVAAGVTASVKMQPGVTVTLHVPVDPPAKRITSAVIDLRHEHFDDPSTTIDYEVEFDPKGSAQLTVAPGNYSWLRLQHEDFFLTPVYSANYQKKSWLRIEPGRNQDLHVDVRRKVSARGRIVEADTGKPLREMSVKGELANGTPRGWADLPSDQWSFAGWGETDAQGQYTIDLAPGLARVTFQGDAFVADQDYYEVSIADGGSTVIPDIKVRPLPKVVGVVQNPDGTPAVRAVVRLRGKIMRVANQPVLTNDSGRFEIQPPWIPVDLETRRRVVVQQVVAFDPYRPLAAKADVRLDQPGKIVLKLEPHEPDWPLSAFSDELTDWERGVLDAAQASKDAAITLRGQTPPEIDSVLWLNTNDRALKLADLRGKYVLLDFWFTGCGPCHGDFPSVKLVHELYKDKGVQVIGIHNNSSPPEAVRKHVAEIGLPFAVAVDHTDGRTVARFEEHGIPDGYPDYVLISPEGKVLLDDRTIPHPSMRAYKVEIVRKFVLESEATRK